jgi:hypothetical protein
MLQTATPEPMFEIAAILARGFLRYRKCRRFQAAEPSQTGLASTPETSRHVTVVNDQRTDEN